VAFYATAKEVAQETAYVGQTARLSCSTNISYYVDWRRLDTLQSDHTYVYSNGQVWPEFQSRFSVEIRNTTDKLYEYALVIANVQPNDSAYYLCKEEAGIGPEHFFHLNVTGTALKAQISVL